MRQVCLSNLEIVPEEYEAAHLDGIDFSSLNSEMNNIERRFINGLIRYYRPKNLLEVGVSYGGGTANILNAIKDMPESRLVSIDKMKQWYKDKSVLVGDAVHAANTELPIGRWNLYAGADPSEVMDKICSPFDFAVIDTAHVHPIETMNFLCILPCLSDGAIVVMHDISLMYRGEPGH